MIGGYHHFLAAVLVLQASHNSSPILALAAEDGTQGDYCSTITTSRECLNEEACVHWTIGKCMSDCFVMDTACYRAKYSFEGMSPDKICTRAENDDKDSALCASMDDCTLCVGAVKSDGVSTCMWFEHKEGGFCTTGCGMNGCGVTTCTATKDALGDATTSSTTTASITTAATVIANTATTTGATAASGSITNTITSSTSVSVEAMSDPSSGSITNERLVSMCTIILVSFALAYHAL